MLAMPWSSKRATHSPQKKNIASQVSQTIDVKEKDHPSSKERGLSAKYFTKRVEGDKDT
jgi:hypothetical protein